MPLFRGVPVAKWKTRARKVNAVVARVNASGFPVALSVVVVATTRMRRRWNRVVAAMPMSGWLRAHVPRAKRRLRNRHVSSIKFRTARRSSVAISRCARVGLAMRIRDAKKAANVATTNARKVVSTRIRVHRAIARMELGRMKDVQSAVSHARMDARSVALASASARNCVMGTAG